MEVGATRRREKGRTTRRKRGTRRTFVIHVTMTKVARGSEITSVTTVIIKAGIGEADRPKEIDNSVIDKRLMI